MGPHTQPLINRQTCKRDGQEEPWTKRVKKARERGGRGGRERGRRGRERGGEGKEERGEGGRERKRERKKTD